MALTKTQTDVEEAFLDEPAIYAADPLLTDIDALNKHHAFVMNGGTAKVMNFCHDPSVGEVLTFSCQSDFKACYANRQTLVYGGDEQGSRLMPLADQWWCHPKRREYAGLTFMPGRPPEIRSPDGSARLYYNLFRGWPVAPKAGDCSLFWEHLQKVICAGNEERYSYVRRWLAHAIQKPEEMPETALVLRGGQGTGKGTLVNIYGKLFGAHYQSISQMDQLLGKFNAHMQEAILVFGDEVTWGGNKQSEGALKSMITEPHMNIERKGMDTIRCANYRRFIFASNEGWPVALGVGDRRFIVLDVDDSYQADTRYFSALRTQMDSGGLQALMHDLLTEDLSNFDVRTKPESGAAEAELFSRTLRGIVRFWYEFLYAADEASWPTSVNRQAFYDEYTAKQPKNSEPEAMSVVGKMLRQMCPSLTNTSPRKHDSQFSMGVGTPTISNGERDQRWRLPPLAEARKAFEVYSKMGAHLWSE